MSRTFLIRADALNSSVRFSFDANDVVPGLFVTSILKYALPILVLSHAISKGPRHFRSTKKFDHKLCTNLFRLGWNWVQIGLLSGMFTHVWGARVWTGSYGKSSCWRREITSRNVHAGPYGWVGFDISFILVIIYFNFLLRTSSFLHWSWPYFKYFILFCVRLHIYSLLLFSLLSRIILHLGYRLHSFIILWAIYYGNIHVCNLQ